MELCIVKDRVGFSVFICLVLSRMEVFLIIRDLIKRWILLKEGFLLFLIINKLEKKSFNKKTQKRLK